MNAADRLARGESVPGGPGACATCGHALVWHRRGGKRRPCEKCDCPAFADQLALLGAEECPAPSSPAARGKGKSRRPKPRPDQPFLFDTGECQ